MERTGQGECVTRAGTISVSRAAVFVDGGAVVAEPKSPAGRRTVHVPRTCFVTFVNTCWLSVVETGCCSRAPTTPTSAPHYQRSPASLPRPREACHEAPRVAPLSATSAGFPLGRGPAARPIIGVADILMPAKEAQPALCHARQATPETVARGERAVGRVRRAELSATTSTSCVKTTAIREASTPQAPRWHAPL